MRAVTLTTSISSAAATFSVSTGALDEGTSIGSIPKQKNVDESLILPQRFMASTPLNIAEHDIFALPNAPTSFQQRADFSFGIRPNNFEWMDQRLTAMHNAPTAAESFAKAGPSPIRMEEDPISKQVSKKKIVFKKKVNRKKTNSNDAHKNMVAAHRAR